ncbi:hypothetical protein SLEP1_g55763 [Rubroshorea leprosula]|uniref:Uncharacterized protein n=1 Tax=Rubroshorea leprosula TaxID=152421 RepID=A0AAV5MIK9_9ROSI|nr:hypothetical protein SLEP1_g55763 [Rubroshorea leprosula]
MSHELPAWCTSCKILAAARVAKSARARTVNCWSMSCEVLKHELQDVEQELHLAQARAHELPSSKARCRIQARADELKSTIQNSSTSCQAQRHDAELQHELPSSKA